MAAGHERIERRVDAVRIIAEHRDVALIMRFPAMRLVDLRLRLVGQELVWAAMKGWRLLLAEARVPSGGKDEVLDRDEHERSVGLRLVDEHGGVTEVGVSARPAD